MVRPKNKLESIWKQIDKKGEDDCWNWTGGLSTGGYPHTSSNLTDSFIVLMFQKVVL